MKVATHVAFAEVCWLAGSGLFGVKYGVGAAGAAALAALLPDADYPESYAGHVLGGASHKLNAWFGHRSALHSLIALLVFAAVLYPLSWWSPPAWAAAVVGYGSHILADMMTLGGVQMLWPSKLICVFPGRDEYRILSGHATERVFFVCCLGGALLLYPLSQSGINGYLYGAGGSDEAFARVEAVTDGDTFEAEIAGQRRTVRIIGVDTPETVAPDEPVGCYGPEASGFAKKALEGKVVKLATPRLGDDVDAYGRMLAYVYLDLDGDQLQEQMFNEQLLEGGYARTTTFAHSYSREFEEARALAEDRRVGLWGTC